MKKTEQDRFRHELKYICSGAQLITLRSRLEALMQRDSHVGKDGAYLIRSLYFDDYEDGCLMENEDGVSPRKKWRIRIYNGSTDYISLECKHKSYDMIRKESCRISLDQFERIYSSSLAIGSGFPELLKRFLTEQYIRMLHPAVIVQYRRYPFVCREGNVRVTLDCNITSAPPVRDFFRKDMPERPVQEKGQHLLEVKFDEYLPDYIYHTVQQTDMRRTAFSKYYLCRRYEAQ